LVTHPYGYGIPAGQIDLKDASGSDLWSNGR
jgi:cytochrome c oxidase subunit 1